MQDAWPVGTFVRDGSDLGHAVMIKYASAAPAFLQLSASRWDAAAGFAGNDEQSHARVLEGDIFVGSDFGEAQAVSRRATNYRHAAFQKQLEARDAAQTAAGETHAANLRCRF